MKRFLVATMALAMLALSATAAVAGHETPGTVKGSNKCADHAHGQNLGQVATATGPYSISVTWSDYCDNEDAFHVLGWNGSAWTTLSTQAGTSFSHTGLACETTYTYKLQAEKYPNHQGNGGQLSESAQFTGTTGACPVEGRDAPAIANEHLRTDADAATACQAKYDGASNWHGKVISAVAHHFEGQSFTPEQEHVVTDWVDGFCAS